MEGVNVTVIVQLLSAGTRGEQLLVCLKSVGPVPVLVGVILMPLTSQSPKLGSTLTCSVIGALVRPWVWFPNASSGAEKVSTGPRPVPLSATVCVVGVALSLMVSVALSEIPAGAGVNLSVMVQKALAASVAGATGQVLVWLKSPALAPEMANGDEEANRSAEPPVLVSVTPTGPELPTGTLPKLTGPGGASVTAGGVPVPVPVSVSVCGLPGALSVMVSVADSPAVVFGVKVNCTVQLEAAFTLMGSAPHVPPPATWAKSPKFAPLSPSAVRVSVAVPVFEKVSVCGALVVFCGWFPNASGFGDAENAGALVAVAASTTPPFAAEL